MSDLITLASHEPGSPEWTEQRRRSVGGSEIAPLLGIGKWESRFSLWHRKQGTIAPQADNPLMEWGRRLEPVIAEKYADDHPELEIYPGGTYTRASRSWQVASPDRLVWDGPHTDDRRLLEIKTAYRDEVWGEPGTDEIPVYYRAQCIWYMDVLNVEVCDVAVLIGGSDYREYTIRYDADEAAYMRGEAEEFIASIERNERPPIDQHDATYQAVRELHPEIAPESVELPMDLVHDFCNARHALATAKDEAQKQTSLIADFMGDAQRGVFLGQTIARRQAKNGGRPYVVAATDLPNFDPKAA